MFSAVFFNFDGPTFSNQAKIAQFGSQCRRQGSVYIIVLQVGRGVFGGQVTPSLKRPETLRFRHYMGAIQNQAANPPAFLILIGFNSQQALAQHDPPPDHPVQRATIKKFVRSAGGIPGNMNQPAPSAGCRCVLQSAFLNLSQVLWILDADAQLDEIKIAQGHAGQPGARRSGPPYPLGDVRRSGPK